MPKGKRNPDSRDRQYERRKRKETSVSKYSGELRERGFVPPKGRLRAVENLRAEDRLEIATIFGDPVFENKRRGGERRKNWPPKEIALFNAFWEKSSARGFQGPSVERYAAMDLPFSQALELEQLKCVMDRNDVSVSERMRIALKRLQGNEKYQAEASARLKKMGKK